MVNSGAEQIEVLGQFNKDKSYTIAKVDGELRARCQMTEFEEGMKREFCEGCEHEGQCATPCPYVMREILGLGRGETL